jgi:glycosyltransferase 2 family protein
MRSALAATCRYDAVMVVRRRLDIELLVLGTIVLCVTAVLARRGVYAWEATAFRSLNELPDGIRPGVWVFNQYGVFITIPLLSVVALLSGQRRLAIALAVSGIGVYLLAKLLKLYVERGRPGDLIDGVIERETFAPDSLGYPSGHAAVAAALTVIVAAYLSRRWAIAAICLAIIVPLCRTYIGAHLPLDLIGGAALGVTAAALVNLVMGVPTRPAAEREPSVGRDPTAAEPA